MENEKKSLTDEELLHLASVNQNRARQVLVASCAVPVWQSIGAEVQLVGSLRTGLLMTHRDIDIHLYSNTLNPAANFRAITQIGMNPRIYRIEYTNLADTPERCFEWHMWFRDKEDELWQLDMIQIQRGSMYAGRFEAVADRILAVMTPKQKVAILRLKYETPESENIKGLEYYMAVIRDGVRTWPEFAVWRQSHPMQGIVEWMP